MNDEKGSKKIRGGSYEGAPRRFFPSLTSTKDVVSEWYRSPLADQILHRSTNAHDRLSERRLSLYEVTGMMRAVAPSCAVHGRAVAPGLRRRARIRRWGGPSTQPPLRVIRHRRLEVEHRFNPLSRDDNRSIAQRTRAPRFKRASFYRVERMRNECGLDSRSILLRGRNYLVGPGLEAGNV